VLDLTGLSVGVRPQADFWVAQGSPDRPPVHVALHTVSRAVMAALHAAAVGAAGPRRHCHEHYYGACVPGPDGHNIEVVCHEPVPAPPGRNAAG
jgi:hypothetical protein